MLDPSVERFGAFLDTDSDGYLVNPCTDDHLAMPWDAPIQHLVDESTAQFGDALHSIYLRGSVPRGQGRTGASDLDAVLIFHEAVPQNAAQWVEESHDSRSAQMPGQTDVEIMALDRASLMEAEWAQPLRALFKTHALCVHGEDLLASLPKIQAGPDLYIHSAQLASDVSEVLGALRTERDPEELKVWCAWVMTRIVRTGLEVLMTETGMYSRDLYPCYTHFCEHRPKQAGSMAQALNWAIAPSSDRRALKRFLSGFGQTLAGEACRLSR